MLWEVWRYWTTPAPACARKLGHLHEAIAMAARYHRCRSAWDLHYQTCQEEIQQAMAKAPGRQTAILFGAGLLQDIPLAALSAHFEQVLLVDLVFLKEARTQAARYPNVQLIQRDVTESLDRLLAGVRRPVEPQWGLDLPVSLVVSLNLATQLPLLPAQYLLKQKAPEMEIDAYGQGLMQAHLAYLQRFQGAQVCLIADRFIEERRSGQVVDTLDPWWGVALPAPQHQWWWQAVPPKEGRGLARWHQVGVSHWRNPATPGLEGA